MIAALSLHSYPAEVKRLVFTRRTLIKGFIYMSGLGLARTGARPRPLAAQETPPTPSFPTLPGELVRAGQLYIHRDLLAAAAYPNETLMIMFVVWQFDTTAHAHSAFSALSQGLLQQEQSLPQVRSVRYADESVAVAGLDNQTTTVGQLVVRAGHDLHWWFADGGPAADPLAILRYAADRVFRRPPGPSLLDHLPRPDEVPADFVLSPLSATPSA